jgi:hypothetical protein
MTVAPGSDANAQDIISSVYMYAADAGGSDTYAVSLPTAPSSYTDGLTVRFKANTANTGAATLNVNTLGAISIKKFGGRDLGTGDIYASDVVEVIYLGGVFYMIGGRELPAFQQIEGTAFQGSGSMIKPESHPPTFGSNSDGSVIYFWTRLASGATFYIQRWERDSLTGKYVSTHVVQTTVTAPTNTCGALVVIGVYLYLFTNDASNVISRRFLAADLTGETTMTVPTVVNTTDHIIAWTDNTDLYIISADSNTTSRRWTVSGTTFTAASTATITSPFATSNAFSSFSDGTTAYWIKYLAPSNGSILRIYKLSAMDGSAYATTDKIFSVCSDNQNGAFITGIDGKKIYVGTCTTTYDEAGEVDTPIRLIPVTKP